MKKSFLTILLITAGIGSYLSLDCCWNYIAVSILWDQEIDKGIIRKKSQFLFRSSRSQKSKIIKNWNSRNPKSRKIKSWIMKMWTSNLYLLLSCSTANKLIHNPITKTKEKSRNKRKKCNKNMKSEFSCDGSWNPKNEESLKEQVSR